MMRRIVIHRPGTHDHLLLEEHPDPQPAPGEVLIDVEGIGVNFADAIVRMGLYASAKKYVGWPITPGFEVAGRVAAVGEGVETPRVGDAVIGLTRFGGYADKLCIPAAQAFPLPAGYSAIEGSAFSVVFLTAWYAMHYLCRLDRGATVLVHSAAGGVGGALLQLARVAGHRAIGVVGGSHKIDEARAMGAAEVIDKSSEELWPNARRLAPDGYDAIFDANGYSTLKQSYAHLAQEGRLVVYGFHAMFPREGGKPNPLRLAWDWWRTPRFDPFDMSQRNKSVLGFNLSYLFERQRRLVEAMEELLAHAAAGELIQPKVTTYPMSEAARAHAALESGQTVGKLVLIP
jgi:synaptic vesicle membrane protein VAT-1